MATIVAVAAGLTRVWGAGRESETTEPDIHTMDVAGRPDGAPDLVSDDTITSGLS